jgi:uncharacterized protein
MNRPTVNHPTGSRPTASGTATFAVATGERIVSLDVLRGFALLGILIMNVQSFAMPEAAYFNPAAWGDLTGANRWVWIIGHVVADQKFMAIFSMLFGAGIVLFAERLESRGVRAAPLHYRRTFWLLVIGLLHAYLVWSGDILVTYAFCSALVFVVRRRSARALLAAGLTLLAAGSAISVLSGLSLPYWPADEVESLMRDWHPTAAQVQPEVDAYRGSWGEQMAARVPGALGLQTVAFVFVLGWRAAGMMLIGMALYRWGVLSAQRSLRVYRILGLVGFGVGLPLIIAGLRRNFAEGWSLEYSMFLGSQFNYWGSVFVALGWMALVVGITRAGVLTRVQKRLAAVGRMALTNYLLQSVLATLVFYGHGLGLFGSVSRLGQLAVVLAIWALQLIASPLWLARFRFGPVEWAWRSLTYFGMPATRGGPVEREEV